MRIRVLIISIALWAATVATAQQQGDPMEGHLFPPELIMKHQQALALTTEQRELVKAEVQNAQKRFSDLQWDMQSETEAMLSLVRNNRIDEQNVMTQLDKVLNIEREIKRTQLTLVIRIKNTLTPDQQARLKELRKQE